MMVATKIQMVVAMAMRMILELSAVALGVLLLGLILHRPELLGEAYPHGKVKSWRMISQMATWMMIG